MISVSLAAHLERFDGSRAQFQRLHNVPLTVNGALPQVSEKYGAAIGACSSQNYISDKLCRKLDRNPIAFVPRNKESMADDVSEVTVVAISRICAAAGRQGAYGRSNSRFCGLCCSPEDQWETRAG
jgi:hypothetical protein